MTRHMYLTPTDRMQSLNQRVIEMASADSKEYKTEWKKLVKSGMVENVQSLLADIYIGMGFRGCYRVETVNAARALGLFESSAAQQDFLVRVIHFMKVKGWFGSLERGFDKFDDTAGGCDELTENAACYLLEHPDWSS